MASPAPLTIKNNSSVTAAPFSAGPVRRAEFIRGAEAQYLGPDDFEMRREIGKMKYAR